MSNKIYENIIIGAGLTGLHLAQRLKELGKFSLILEKSKGVGGRVATRRIDDLGLDHGALYLDENFYFSQGLPLSSPQGMYRTGGMNLLAKNLAPGLDILKNQKVSELKFKEDVWEVSTDEGLKLLAKNVILTAPVPQARELLEQNNLSVLGLEGIRYKKAIVYLVTFSDLPKEFTSFMALGHRFTFMRERGLHPLGLVVHVNEDLAEKIFEARDEIILQNCQELLKASQLKNLKISTEELKKWRYSVSVNRHSSSFLEVTPGLFVTGDGFSGALHSINNLVQVLRSLA